MDNGVFIICSGHFDGLIVISLLTGETVSKIKSDGWVTSFTILSNAPGKESILFAIDSKITIYQREEEGEIVEDD